MGSRLNHFVCWLMALTVGVLMHVCICAPAAAAVAPAASGEHKCCKQSSPVQKSKHLPGEPCRHCEVKAGTVAEKPAGPSMAPGLSLLAIAPPIEPRLETVVGNVRGNRGAASVPIWLPPSDLVHSFCQLTV